MKGLCTTPGTVPERGLSLFPDQSVETSSQQRLSLWGQSLKGQSLIVTIACLLALSLAGPLLAQGTGPIPELANRQLENPAQEAEATALMENLRCIQCQSQSIADSDAPMAASMRAEVRQQIASGKKADEVRSWMIQRYGQWVSFEPEMRGTGLLLWLAPLLLLAVALLLARGLFRKPRT